MTKFDYDSAAEALLERVGDVRTQVIGFVRELDGVGVVPGFLPEGAMEALAEADAALAALELRLDAGEAGVAEIADAERRIGDVEAHIREVQQDLWRAAVKMRVR